MTALAADKSARTENWRYRQFTLASGSQSFKNGVAAMQRGVGTVVPMSNAPGLVPIGWFAEGVDATAAAKSVNVRLFVEYELYRQVNDGTSALAATDVGSACFFIDDQTVSADDAGGANPYAGVVLDVSSTTGVAVLPPMPATPGAVQVQSYGTDIADADATIQVAGGLVRKCPTLTGNHTCTLGVTGAARGMVMFITRTSTAANTLAVANGGGGGGTLMTFAASKQGGAAFFFDGTDWQLLFCPQSA